MWQNEHGSIGGAIHTYLYGHNEELKEPPLRITDVGIEIGTRELKKRRNV
jgi:hypothetical protein